MCDVSKINSSLSECYKVKLDGTELLFEMEVERRVEIKNDSFLLLLLGTRNPLPVHHSISIC